MNPRLQETNEIRDFLSLAPKRLTFNGHGMIDATLVREKWLNTIYQGSLHDKINRRAGIFFTWTPWKTPIRGAIMRNHRNKLRKQGLKYFGPSR